MFGRVVLALTLLLASGATAAPASAARAQPISSYCSPSGDICFGVVDRSGAVYLELSTFARYFDRYRLCVRPPGRAERCGSFPVFRRGLVWGSAVKFSRNFPNVGSGSYRVTWKLGPQRLGPTLRFRLPLTR